MGENGARGSGLLAWLRALPRSSVLVFCAALLAAIQTILGLLDAPVWTRVTGAIWVLAVAGASELDKLHTKRQEAEQAEQRQRETDAATEAEWQQKAQDCLRLWPAPSLADADPYELGVVRSSLADRYTTAEEVLPPYVPRDIDPRALKRLQSEGLLLIVGAPASGPTRTAYQVAKVDFARRLVLAPEPPHGLKTALDKLDVVSRLAPPARLLLWLDRIDEFSAAGLTVAMLRRCRQRSPGLRVVATISSTHYAAWASQNPEVLAEFGKPVTLERLPTP